MVHPQGGGVDVLDFAFGMVDDVEDVDYLSFELRMMTIKLWVLLCRVSLRTGVL